MKPLSVGLLYMVAPIALAVLSPEAGIPADGCVFNGEDFVWFVSAPDGWALSCIAGEHPEVPIALWPASSTWETASAVLYISPTARSGPDRSLQEVVTSEVARFRRDNPTVTVIEAAPIQTKGEGAATVRHYSGDRWGNFEAVAYIDTKGPVAVVVLSTKNEADFKRSYAAFETLVTSRLP